MKLTPVEASSGLWTRLDEHYRPMLAKLRLRAENPILAEADRLPLLWQIKIINDLLAMAEPEPVKKYARD